MIRPRVLTLEDYLDGVNFAYHGGKVDPHKWVDDLKARADLASHEALM